MSRLDLYVAGEEPCPYCGATSWADDIERRIHMLDCARPEVREPAACLQAPARVRLPLYVVDECKYCGVKLPADPSERHEHVRACSGLAYEAEYRRRLR